MSGHMSIAHVKSVLAGKGYDLREKISAGSFAVVRSLKDVKRGSTLAIKLIDRSKAPQDFLEKFLPKELAVCEKLKHENVINMVDAMDVGWYTCILMEKAEGGDLLELISRGGALSEDRVKVLGAEILRGLKYMHDMDIAHRDIKCENILLDLHQHIKLADFGFARSCLNPTSQARELSQTYCGSAAYAAPEVMQGRPYNPLLSDVWSLGVVFYIMVCGIMPFDDSNHRRMLRAQLEKAWNWHPDRKAGISVLMRLAVRKILEPDNILRPPIALIMKMEWLREQFPIDTTSAYDIIQM